jgi:hypothetical protein
MKKKYSRNLQTNSEESPIDYTAKGAEARKGDNETTQTKREVCVSEMKRGQRHREECV